MGKKIRHLEFYGYTDQNVYVGFPNSAGVDLTNIREVNKEQDEELKRLAELAETKIGKDEFDDLTHSLRKINVKVSHILRNHDLRLGNLEDNLSSIGIKINEVIEELNNVFGNDDDGEVINIPDLSEKLNNLESAFNQHLDNGGHTSEELENIKEELGNKLDKDGADNIYLKKDDAYTKEEVDDKLVSFVTEEWLDENGYLSSDKIDGGYASNEGLEALKNELKDLSDSLQSTLSDITDKMSKLKDKVDERFGNVKSRMASLESMMELLKGNIDREISSLSQRVEKNATDIQNIKSELAKKTEASDLDGFKDDIQSIKDALSEKLNKNELNAYKIELGTQLEKKADKTELNNAVNTLNNDLTSLKNSLNAEKQYRKEGDDALRAEIEAMKDAVNKAEADASDVKDGISTLNDALQTEINDRKAADNAIVGSETDTFEDNTIWGAKKYADYKDNQLYGKVSQEAINLKNKLKNELSELIDDVNTKTSKKANKAYVDKAISEISARIDLITGVEFEGQQTVDEKLNSKIDQEIEDRINADYAIKEDLNHTSNVVHAITEWEGSGQYDDSGNGILDVLHREFHALKTRLEDYEEMNNKLIETIAILTEHINNENAHFVNNEKEYLVSLFDKEY